VTSSSSISCGRTNDRNTLLLAAGESVGIIVAFVGEPEAREEL
jgi:hypothetical protein